MIQEKNNFYDLKKLKILSNQLSKKLKKGSIVCLKGELGAGKTTFSRFIINNLNELKKIKKPTSIKSPSFPILLTYDLGELELFHYDLYRIEKKSELDELNIEENIFKTITLIEWPEILFKQNFNFNFYLIEIIIHDKNLRMINTKMINKY